MRLLLPAIYHACKPHRKQLLLFAGAVISIFTLLSFRLTTNEDIRDLVPTHPLSIGQDLAYMQQAPFLRLLTITVGGNTEKPQIMADAVAKAIKSPLIPDVMTGPPVTLSNSIVALSSYIPALLSPEDITALENSLTPTQINAALQQNVKQLLSPSGIALRELVALDPIRVHAILFHRFANLSRVGVYTGHNGYFIDSSGKYALVLAKPAAPMTDTTAASAVMDIANKAITELPPGTEHYITGSYRHSEANALVIKHDLQRILPLSFFLLGILSMSFLRNRYAFSILIVPLAAFSVAGVVSATLHGSISGIVLGFGSILLGITIDYATHTYYAISTATSEAQGLADITKPLFTAAITTTAGFAALHFSSIPAIRQVALFGIVGIGVALLVALLVLPQILVARPVAGHIFCAGQRRTVSPLPTLALSAFFIVIIIACFCTLHFNGNIRALSYATPKILQDEEKTRSIWSAPREGAFIVAEGDGSDLGFEKALQINENVFSILQKEGIRVSSIAPFLPSRENQEKNIAAWTSLWNTHGTDVLNTLAVAGQQNGFAANAFRPFAEWINAKPQLITPALLHSQPVGVLMELLLARDKAHSFVFTLLPNAVEINATTQLKIENAGGHIVSMSDIGNNISSAAGQDTLYFCLLAVTATSFAIFMVFGLSFRALAVLLPMLAGLSCTLGVFKILEVSLNLFHTVALPLVITLSVDYGIFMQAVLECRLDGATKKAVVLSALTTLAGFGSLLFAEHPALYSVGITVTGGIIASLLAALWIQPLLTRDSTGA